MIYCIISNLRAKRQKIFFLIAALLLFHANCLLASETSELHWYENLAKYRIGSAADALAIIREFGIGVKNSDLLKIPTGLLNANGMDSDKDGLTDEMEKILGTNPDKTDSDGDNYADAVEILNGYNPLGEGKISTDKKLIAKVKGKILLQVENLGAAWFVNPADGKKYYLGRPADAWNVINALGLLDQIELLKNQIDSAAASPESDQSAILAKTADAIRKNDIGMAKTFFTAEMQKIVEYTMNILSPDSRMLLANILSSAKLSEQSEKQKTYQAKAYFYLGGYDIRVYFHIKRQQDGSWLISNL